MKITHNAFFWAVVAASLSCDGSGSGEVPNADLTSGVLSSLGFALTPSGEAGSSRTLEASFAAPVLDLAVNAEAVVETYGSASLSIDSVVREMSSMFILSSIEDNDTSYGIIFDETAPWVYALVAASEGSFTPGVTLSLDGELAAAIVVDEAAGTAYVSEEGTLSVTSAELVEGGQIVASLTSSLVEVVLAASPQDVDPFAPDPENVAASGSGRFDAPWRQGVGTTDLVITVDNYPPFTPNEVSSSTLGEGEGQTTILLFTEAPEIARWLMVEVDTAALVPGTTIAIDGFLTRAELVGPNDTQISMTGSLTLESVNLDEGGSIVGSLQVERGVVTPQGEAPGVVDCEDIEGNIARFTPSEAKLFDGFPEGELPPDYDRLLGIFAQSGDFIQIALLRDVDLSVATPYAFSTLVFEGTSYPVAFLDVVGCGGIEFDSGVLEAAIDGANLSGTLRVVRAGQEESWTFSVPLI
jgi:hypothetical protein